MEDKKMFNNEYVLDNVEWVYIILYISDVYPLEYVETASS
jgi:hypothetical protein